ncbi:MAG: adenylyltransferase/cytidyltransferase family protein [Phycisphaerales bacterium]|nr:MAG: adenylyltransferase/cytidyltransferase family protein [Phycisphaerales bacterium]
MTSAWISVGRSASQDMSNRYLQKIVSIDQLVAAIEGHRREGRRIVHCHGCFDIVHPGHLRYLQFARRQGDVLLVSLTGDADISKGAQHPYIPEELRAENLAALEMVDLVYVDPNVTAAPLLQVVKPDIYVKGKEYETSGDPRFLEERRVVESHGGTVIFSSGDVVYSSTSLMETMADRDGLRAQRLPWVCKRHNISSEILSAVIDNFTGQRVIVAGDIILDRYVHCDAVSVAAESAMLSLTQLDTQRYLGGSGVVARHLAALGASPYVLAHCGFDERSDWAIAQLQAENIDGHVVRCAPSVPEKSRFLVEGTKLLKVEESEAAPLDSISQRTAADVLLEQARGAAALILCDYGYGMLAGGWLEQVLPALRSIVKVISADVSGVRGNLLRFVDVDFLTPTERELRSAVGDFESGLSSAAWKVMEKTRARRLLVTLGKDGLVAFDRASQDINAPEFHARLRSEQLPALAEHAVDRLGCGDALLAATTLAMAGGASFMQAAFLGSVAAGLEVTRLGNVPVSRADLRRCLGFVVGEQDEWPEPTGEETLIRRANVEPIRKPPSLRRSDRVRPIMVGAP